MKATARAHANIALVKYWGKRDERLILPHQSSLSLTLAPLSVKTTVEWGANAHEVELNGKTAEGSERQRVVDILELPQPLVSRHLAYLRRTGLVDVTRESKYAHYRLAEPAHPVHRNLVNCVRSCFTGIKSLDRERARAVKRVAARESAPC